MEEVVFQTNAPVFQLITDYNKIGAVFLGRPIDLLSQLTINNMTHDSPGGRVDAPATCDISQLVRTGLSQKTIQLLSFSDHLYYI